MNKNFRFAWACWWGCSQCRLFPRPIPQGGDAHHQNDHEFDHHHDCYFRDCHDHEYDDYHDCYDHYNAQ